jgi:hypothetical protein
MGVSGIAMQTAALPMCRNRDGTFGGKSLSPIRPGINERLLHCVNLGGVSSLSGNVKLGTSGSLSGSSGVLLPEVELEYCYISIM